MTGTAFIRSQSELPRALNVLGEHVTVLASGAATGGYEIFRQEGEPGQGPPPHAHDWDESFLVVAGKVEIGIGERSVICGPGSIAHVPAGTSHWFRFETGGEMISVTSKLGASEFFADVDRAAPKGPLDLETTLAVAERHGLTVFAPAAGALV